MADKSFILKSYLNHLMEFVDEVIKLYPKNINLKTGKTFLTMLRRANPKKVIVCWHDSVLKLYENEIHEDNYDFFEKKDYTEDLLRNGWGEQIESILKIIDEIKEEIKDESEENKRKALKYMINLNKLCKIYFQ
jgi:hypothetical protein|tara:strand:+ start:153 stop:554 length:402 start_codon:yes stop_codon:yes gene_type:complete